MSWKNVKALKEQRAALFRDAIKITESAKSEDRDLNADESKRHGELMDKLNRLNLELIEADSDGANGDETRSRIGRDFSTATAIDDNAEVRALRPNESCADYIRRKVNASETKIGFGQMLRAMVMGGRNAEEKRALSEGTDSAGGYTVNPFLSATVVDRLRPQAVCMKAGAQVVPLLSDKHNFAKVTADPTATWRAENASVNSSGPTFGQVAFVPKTLAVIVPVSRELMEDSLNINTALEQVFAGAFATELDRVALVGSSGSGEPNGILNFSGVNSVSMGTNGGAITDYSKILDAVQKVEEANTSATAAVMAPRTSRTINGLVDTLGQPLRRPASLESLPFYVTTGVPTNQTKGSGSNLSSIFVGDFSRLWFGIRTELRIEVLREVYAANFQYAFLAYLRADVQASHENAFSWINGVQ